MVFNSTLTGCLVRLKSSGGWTEDVYRVVTAYFYEYVNKVYVHCAAPDGTIVKSDVLDVRLLTNAELDKLSIATTLRQGRIL